MKIVECEVNPSGGYLRYQPFAPMGFDKSEADVDPTVFPEYKQPRITNRTIRIAIQNEVSIVACTDLYLLGNRQV